MERMGRYQSPLIRLLREAADVIAEARRAMQEAIDDDTCMSGYRLLRFQAAIDRMEGGGLRD